MANARGPYYVIINYHSEFGIHSHTLQTNTWTNAASAGNKGQFIDHNGAGRDALDMITDLVDFLLDMYPDTVTYDNWTIFHQPADPGPSFPQKSGSFTGKIGTSALGGWAKATQATFWFKTALFGDAKLVLLDMDSGNDFNKVTSGFRAEILSIASAFEDAANAWCGKDNSQPLSLLSVTPDLNDALRKQYRMT